MDTKKNNININNNENKNIEKIKGENNEDDDENYYEGIIKEYGTKEIKDKNIKPNKNEKQKRMCCILF
jgi:hypothetical protein